MEEGEGRRSRREPHPLLRGGRTERHYNHGFSSSDMQSLASICETFVPSIPLESLHLYSKVDPPNKSLESFYLSSASQHPIPDKVAEKLVRRNLPQGVFLVRLVLKLLSTRLGTLLLCGSLCLAGNFPFVNKFSDMSFENREKVLQRWSRAKRIKYFRAVFAIFNIMCLYTFFSRFWLAMLFGYGLYCSSTGGHTRLYCNIFLSVYSKVSGETALKVPTVDVSSKEFYREGYDDSDKRIPDMTIINRQLGWNRKTSLWDLLESTLTYQHRTYAEAVKKAIAKPVATS